MSFYKEVPGRQTTLESTLKFDTTPTAGSTNPVTSGAVKDVEEKADAAAEALQEQIDDIAEKAGSGYTPKGEATVATLNGLSGQENGELYTMTDAGTLTDGSLAVVAGDTVAWDATNSVWYKAMDYAPRQYGTNEVHNLPTSITAFRAGDVIPVDGPSGTAKMSKDDLIAQVRGSTFESIENAYLNSDGTTTASGTRGVSDYIDVGLVDSIIISKSWDVSAGGCFVCFYDEDKIFVSYASTTPNTAVDNYVQTIPSGAKYARITLADKSVPVIVDFGTNYPYEIYADVNSFKREFEFSVSYKEEGYLNTSGCIEANVSPYQRGVSDYIDVHTLSSITIKSGSWAIGSQSGTFACAYDKDRKFISYFSQTPYNTKILDKTIDVSSAYYIRITLTDYTNDLSICVLETRAGFDSDKALTEINNIKNSVQVIEGKDSGYLSTTGTIVANVSPYKRMVSDYVDVSDVDTLEILLGSWAIGSQSGTFACAYDKDKTFIKAFAQTPYNTAITNKLINVYGVKYIRITLTDDITPIFLKKVSSFRGSGLFGVFEKVGILGGSLASGASFYKDSGGVFHGVDNYKFSWLRYLVAHYGNEVYRNFSAGGTSARSWLTNASIGPNKLNEIGQECDAYILFFGGNDALILDGDPTYLGTIADCNVGDESSNPDTFYGNLSKIIALVKARVSRTKIFAFTYNKLMTTASSSSVLAINEATRNVVALYTDTYLVDIENDLFIENWYNETLKYKAHYPAIAYKSWSEHFAELLDDIMFDNYQEFRDVQFIGTNYDIVEC